MINPLCVPKGFTIFCIAFFGCFCLSAQPIAQSTPINFSSSLKNNLSEVRPLTIGDKVPELLLTNIYNYPAKTSNLSDFKGRLLILDFWATWCSSCAETFPKMQVLQNKFVNELQVILINSYLGDDEKKVANYFEKRRMRTGETLELPYILQDSILSSYFTHKYIPHYVWIDKNMIVKAITSQTEITETNIYAVLEGKNILIQTKNDDLVYDGKTSLLDDNKDNEENEFLYRSIITGHKDGLGSVIGSIPDESGKISKFYVINYPLLTLFQIAYRDVFKYPLNRILVETSKISRAQLLNIAQAKYQNTYCYEIVTSPVPKDAILKYMQEDLSRNFHLMAKIEMRTIECLSLTINSKIKSAISKGGFSELDISANSLKKHIRNERVSVLIELLNSLSAKPVINKTGLIKNIDIDLPYDIYSYDLIKLRDFLQSIGFDLNEEKRQLEVSVITDDLEE